MNKQMILVVLKRFARTLAAAFVASALAQLSQGTTVNSLEDLKKFGYSLIVAGIAGTLTAIDKALRYEPEQESTP